MWIPPKSKKATQEAVEALLTRDNPKALVRALMAIYANQEADEKRSEDTKFDNDKGFTGHDARILTRFAKQWQERNWLSDRQLDILAEKMPKYRRQLAERAAKNAAYYQERQAA
jgi:hypothetical protein